MELLTIALVGGGAFLAGGMNAMAGGGTFFSFPALLAAGVPPVTANASNTVALWPASLSSAWAYRRELLRHKSWVILLTVVALIMVSLAVLVHFWDSPQRTLVAWLVAAVWAAGWAAATVSLVSVAQRAGSGFALTRRELAQDWRDIKERL